MTWVTYGSDKAYKLDSYGMTLDTPLFHFFASDEVRMFSKINRNIYKPPVAEATKEIVRKNFTREIEFLFFYMSNRVLQARSPGSLSKKNE